MKKIIILIVCLLALVSCETLGFKFGKFSTYDTTIKDSNIISCENEVD